MSANNLEAEINGENLISHLEPDGGIEADWSTAGFSKTKSRSRCNIRLMLRGVFGSVTQDLQCKFYDISDPHAQWGDKFRQMVLLSLPCRLAVASKSRLNACICLFIYLSSIYMSVLFVNDRFICRLRKLTTLLAKHIQSVKLGTQGQTGNGLG
ncbi:hypothetical protein Tsp_05997 [Trichinella spiralis]|uniref:hypothetical protein n=1 Tax=Trichinella spiralis TaxID=6334 RepID=UPI0001EFCDE2|nr:hypothetical protein Tsp_05997 [Trichinella spiralis]